MDKAIRFYHFYNPFDDQFADASRLGTWYPDPGPGPCKECGTSQQQRIKPLIIEWEPGSDTIGDFTWPGSLCDVIVIDRVRKCFEAKGFMGFEFGEVKMVQNPKLKPPKKVTKRTKPRVWLPYDGPPLWDFWVTKWCHLDIERSKMKIDKICSTCGKKFYKFPEKDKLIIDSKTWSGEHIFRIYEAPVLIFLVEEVKKTIEENKFTNVLFREEGIIDMS